MKVMIIGRWDGWMGVHLNQLANGFQECGREVIPLNYHSCGEKKWWSFLSNRGEEKYQKTEALKKILREKKPDILFFSTARLIFDFAELRANFSGSIVFYDMDGPASPYYEEGLDWIKNVDALATVSRFTLRQLEKKGVTNAFYLPHGVDTNYYSPVSLSEKERERFCATLSFVGRPTPRRGDFMESIAQENLCLWGRRWSKKPYCENSALINRVREKGDVVGDDLNKLYNATDIMVNVLREPFIKDLTIMNLQVFAVPAAGRCLLTEWVEEIEDAFIPGEELLVFRSQEEFQEQAQRYTKDIKAAHKIGKAGRERCLREHTHAHRVKELEKVLGL